MMRRLVDVYFSENPAEQAFVIEYLTNLAHGEPGNVTPETWDRAQRAWAATVRLFRSLHAAYPENAAMDFLTMTKGQAAQFSKVRKFFANR